MSNYLIDIFLAAGYISLKEAYELFVHDYFEMPCEDPRKFCVGNGLTFENSEFENKKIKILEYLKYRDFDFANAYNGPNSPLHLALKYTQLSIVRKLIEYGVNPNYPYHFPIVHTRYDENRVPFKVLDTETYVVSALHYALDLEETELVELLVRSGANQYVRSNGSLVHYSAYNREYMENIREEKRMNKFNPKKRGRPPPYMANFQ